MSRDLTVADVLNSAADLCEQGWCQGTYARGKSGREVHPENRAARSWCAHGALIRATVKGGGLVPAFNALERQIEGRCVDAWNDEPDRTQAEVVAALRKAAGEYR